MPIVLRDGDTVGERQVMVINHVVYKMRSGIEYTERVIMAVILCHRSAQINQIRNTPPVDIRGAKRR
jgi:hypothetical protein